MGGLFSYLPLGNVDSLWEREDKNILRWIIAYNELRFWVHLMILAITDNQLNYKVHGITPD